MRDAVIEHLDVETDEREESYPLSSMQQGMLFHSLYAPSSGVYVQQLLCTLREDLDVAAFKRAWQQVVQRNAVLRTSFHLNNPGRPLQTVHRQVSVPWLQEDWRGLPAEQQEERLQAHLCADRKRDFELTTAPLLRLALFRVADSEYRLVRTMHHALFDGRALVVVLRELFACYEALCKGQEVELGPLRPYRDYIQWLEEQDWSQAEGFWRVMLRGFMSPTPLPGSREQGQAASGDDAYGGQETHLSETMTIELEALAQRHQVTLTTLLQGAWALVLSRYSGEDDVVFGATRSCHRWASGGAAESIVGLLINTLPLRVRVSSDEALPEWLAAIRKLWVATREYEHISLAKVQEWSDVPAGKPLFESIVVFDRGSPNDVLRASGGAWTNREVQVLQRTNYPLTVAGRGGSRLALSIAYQKRHYDAATVARMLGHLRTALAGMVANPDAPVGRLSLLTEAEQHQLLVEWNETEVAYPADESIQQLFEAQVQRTPEAMAVEYGEQRVSYGELNARANQLGRYLRKRGVGPDVLVGICLERSVELILGILGILKAGGAYVPLDPGYPAERLALMCEDAGMALWLTDSRLVDVVPAKGVEAVYVDRDSEAVAREGRENVDSGVTPDNLAYVIYTSGSTGRPNGVMVAHRGLHNVIASHLQSFPPQPGCRLLHMYSFSFDAAAAQAFIALCSGGTLCLAGEEWLGSSAGLARMLRQRAITHAGSAPSVLMSMMPDELPDLRMIIAGGEVCPAEVVERWGAGRRLLNAYGPTETSIRSTVAECHDASRKPAIGRPIANTQVYILDDELQPVPIGVTGELYIGGVGLARGYLKRAGLTAWRFVPNPFSRQGGARMYRTGDLARYLADGNIDFVGRVDDQVKVRGFRIEVGEIEALLGEHPAVGQAVVVVREEEGMGPYLVAYVVAQEGQGVEVGELRSYLRGKLPGYMMPGAFVVLEALPRTPSGKLDRRSLPAPSRERIQTSEGFVAPRTAVEEAVAQVWAEVLGLERVSAHDNFFELGGHSLLATQVISRICRALEVRVQLRDLFDRPTVAQLAQAVVEKGRTDSRRGQVS